MKKVTIKVLTEAFHSKVDDAISKMLLASNIRIDKLDAHRRLIESQLRLVWTGDKTCDELNVQFPLAILYPEFTIEFAEPTNHLTLAGHPMVLRKGAKEESSIFALPIFDADLPYKAGLDLSALSIHNDEYVAVLDDALEQADIFEAEMQDFEENELDISYE